MSSEVRRERRKIDKEMRTTILFLAKAGMNNASIARQMKLPYQTVSRIASTESSQNHAREMLVNATD
ncbi:unnamed protein product [Anisakis simplex]|uniref:HTH psq-type domain-containing protein n=1 Tax=Anisakis simplex TaxID=6269 RepID=A0A0M3JIY0_ANISI|nr:unnamed protein product [Anisakis simplex]